SGGRSRAVRQFQAETRRPARSGTRQRRSFHQVEPGVATSAWSLSSASRRQGPSNGSHRQCDDLDRNSAALAAQRLTLPTLNVYIGKRAAAEENVMRQPAERRQP